MAALVLSVAACATATAPLVSATPGVMHASILAVRAVPPGALQGMAARALGSMAAPPAALTEFIVRTSDGRTISVVQPAQADLQPGTEAVLTPGSRPRLTL